MTERLINNNPFVLGESETHSIDGTGNNLEYPEYGAANSPLLNVAPLEYGDGYSTPAGAERPNPRTISNAVSQQNEDIPSDRGLTNFIWAFGQFVDHDLDLTPELEGTDASIPVQRGDPFLDPQGTGNVEIELSDSEFIEGTGTGPDNPRQLPNVLTSWLDGSNIYGSDSERNQFLRAFEGGKLKVSSGDFLPFNDGSLANDNPRGSDPTSLFVAGDVRANENSVLISMHTLFVREHNRIATQLATAHPDWNDEQIFQRARAINIAQYQSIIYNEYLPSLLGVDALPEYSSYDATVNPNISRTFSTAAFRLGHTQLSSEIVRLDPTGQEIEQGNLTLADVFFRPSSVVQEAGIDPIVRGIASSLSQNVDTETIDDVRNLLFGFGENVSGRDLVAINIQRGRLHGLANYNTIRESFGLERVTSFSEITSDSDKQAALQELYGSVDNIDAFIGLLAEDHVPGAAVGETIQAVLVDQFVRLRDGDRFYYENTFSPEEIAEIENTTFSEIIRRNTDTTIIQDNVFSLINQGTEDSDILNGGLGDDTIYGNGGNDHVYGFAGDDLLLGGDGSDQLLGDVGADTVTGGSGIDMLAGGAGADTFQFGGDNLLFEQLGLDLMMDFNPAEDQIVLDHSSFTELSETINFEVASNPAAAALTAADIVYDQCTGIVAYNTDGATPGFGNGNIFAQLNSGLELSSNNFDVV